MCPRSCCSRAHRREACSDVYTRLTPSTDNGICTYTTGANTGVCTDTYNYLSGPQTILSQILTYPGTVTSYVLGSPQSSTGGHFSNGAVAGIIVAVIVCVKSR